MLRMKGNTVQQGWDIAEPRADALIESLRAFGYSPEAAIADLVDNSISAEAKNIWIDFYWAGADSTVRVTDDGRGMTESSLIAAMRPGSMSPLEQRVAKDLGRFGLGLKTASFSQAREVTVMSSTCSGESSTRRWDLDTVADSGEWRLLRTAPAGVKPTHTLGSGTDVVWSKLDRLVGDVDAQDVKAHRRFLATVERVQHHLEATFHQFLVGPGRTSILVNGQVIDPWDPFMRNHPATQQFDAEELPYKGESIRVTSYVLPHRSKLDEAQMARGAGLHGWNQQQGFYVYRSGRLLVQGDWLGLGLAKDEHTKLARIAVEFPSSLDHDWQVDVKKSTARPPGELADALKRIAKSTRAKAEEVYRYKGKIIARKTSQPFVFAWLEQKGRNGEVRFRVNREHPVIAAAKDAMGKDTKPFERALRFIEENIPTTAIGVHIAESLDTTPVPFANSKNEIRPLLDFTYQGLIAQGASPEEAIIRIAAIEPFSYYPEIIAVYREQIA